MLCICLLCMDDVITPVDFLMYICSCFFDGVGYAPSPWLSRFSQAQGGTNFFARPRGAPVDIASILCEIPKRNFRIQFVKKEDERELRLYNY